MPRPNDPGTITVGGGLASSESIETNAFIHPTGGQEGLRVHIQDPSRAHEARAIHVVDAADLFTSDHVEGALEELAGSASAGRNNGLVNGGLFTSSVGLVFELDATTEALLGGTVTDVSGLQVALTPSATQYVYLDSGTGVLTTSPTAPLLAAEPILLWEITTNGAGITSSRDLRFFVFNLDRKVSLTVRSAGSSFNQRSEAQFVTLEAALAYLDLYAGDGSDPVETHKIIVRGNIDLATTQTIPVNGVVFEGDGTGVFTNTALVTPLFDLNGQSRIKFINLGFIASSGASTAIGSSSNVDGLRIDQCTFGTSGPNWAGIVNLSGTANTNTVIRDCVVTGIDGDAFTIERPTDLVIENVRITAVASTAGTRGIRLNGAAGSATPGEGSCVLSNCTIDGFTDSVVAWVNSLVVENCLLTDARQALTVGGGQMTLKDNVIILSTDDSATTGALTGISLEIGSNISVAGCEISCLRTLWTAGNNPSGIRIANVGTVSNVHLDGCNISGFYNDVALSGVGVGHDDTIDDFKMTNCVINTAFLGAQLEGNRAVVSGCSFTNVTQGLVAGGSREIALSDNHIELSSSTGLVGITLSSCDGAKLTTNDIRNLRSVWPGSAPIGIDVNGSADIVISGCHVEGFLDTTNFSGVGINLAGACPNMRISDTLIRTTLIGVEIASSTSEHVLIDTCIFDVCRIAVRSGGDHTTVSNCDIELSSQDDTSGAIYGIQFLRFFGTASNCKIRTTRRWLSGPTGDIPVGINFSEDSSDQGVANSCQIDGFYNETDELGIGINIRSGASNVTAEGCLIGLSQEGVVASGASSRIQGCKIEQTVTGIVSLGLKNIIADCTVVLHPDTGLVGIVSGADHTKISGCDIYNPRNDDGNPWTPGELTTGIQVVGDYTKITDCRLDGFHNTLDGTGVSLQIEAKNGPTVTGTTFEGGLVYVANFDAGGTQFTVSEVVLTGNTYLSPVLASVFLNGTGLIVESVLVSDSTFEGGITQVSLQGLAGVTVSNCSFNGLEGATTSGIRLDGDVTTPLQQFSVVGNVLKGISSVAINMNDNVKEGVVSGNVIDGHIGDNIEIFGLGINVNSGAGEFPSDIEISGNTVFNCITGVAATGSATDPVFNVSVVGNILHHIARDTPPSDTLTGAGGCAVLLYYALGGVISNNTIHDMGFFLNPDGTTFTPAGGDYAVQGIYALNCQRFNVSGNHIRRLVPAGTGFARGISLRQRNNPGSITSEGFVVTGNTIVATSTTLVTALIFVDLDDDLLNGTQRMNGVVISDNALESGANSILMRLGNSPEMTGVSITGNTCTTPGNVGINITCVGITDALLRNLTITGNTIFEASVGGIGVNMAIGEPSDVINGEVSNVTINGNTISGECNTAGISLAALNAGTNSSSSYKNVSVIGNTLETIEGAGITVIVFGEGAGSTMAALSINGNSLEIQGARDGIALACAYASGIGTGLSSIAGLEVNQNQIQGTGLDNGVVARLLSETASITASSFSGNIIGTCNGAGMQLRTSRAGTWENLQVNGNNINFPGSNGIEMAVADGTMDNVQVNGNEIRNAGNATADLSQGVGIALLAGNGETRDWSVNDNTITNVGTTGIALGGFEVVQQATGSVTFGNLVAGNEVEFGGATLTAIDVGPPGADQFVIGGGGPAGTAQNFQDAVNDTATNPSYAAIASASGGGGSSATVTLTAVPIGAAGNSLGLSSSVNITVSGGFFSGGAGGSGDSSILRRFTVSRNLITDAGQTGIIVLTYDGVVTSLTINENMISRPGVLGSGGPSTRGAGILVGAAQDASSVVFEDLTFTGNRITWNAGDTGGASAYGIGLLAVNCDLDDVTLSDNQIEESPASGVFALITADPASGNGRLTNLHISDCTIKSNANVGGGVPHYAIGIFIQASGFSDPHKSISVRGCKLRSAKQGNNLAACVGIFAFPNGSPNGTKFSLMDVSNNSMEESDSGFLWSTYVGTGGTWLGDDPIMENIQVSNNQFRDLSIFGVACYGSATSAGDDQDLRMESVSITHNTFTDVATDATFGFSAISLNYARPWSNLRVDSNSLTDCGVFVNSLFGAIDLAIGEGAEFPRGGVTNLSVCHNSIINPTAQGINVRNAGLGGVDSNWQNIRICDNQISNGSSGGITLDMQANDDNLCRNIVVDSNQVHETGGAFGIRVQMGSQNAAGVFGLSVSNNKISRLTTAGSDGIILFLGGGTGTALTDASISHNVISGFHDHGIAFNATGQAGICRDVCIIGNSISGIGPGGSASGGGGLNMLMGSSWTEIVVSSNIVRQCFNGFNFQFLAGTFAAWSVVGNVSTANTNSAVQTMPLGASITPNRMQCQGNISTGPGNDWTTSTDNFVNRTGANDTTNTDY